MRPLSGTYVNSGVFPWPWGGGDAAKRAKETAKAWKKPPGRCATAFYPPSRDSSPRRTTRRPGGDGAHQFIAGHRPQGTLRHGARTARIVAALDRDPGGDSRLFTRKRPLLAGGQQQWRRRCPAKPPAAPCDSPIQPENPSLAATVARSTAILRRTRGIWRPRRRRSFIKPPGTAAGTSPPSLARRSTEDQGAAANLGGSKPAAVHVAAMEALLQSTHGSSEIALPDNRLARRNMTFFPSSRRKIPSFPGDPSAWRGGVPSRAKLWVSLGAPEIWKKMWIFCPLLR